MMRGLYGSMLLIFLWSTCSYAQEIVLDSDVGMGARNIAMGGASTALSNDFSGLYSNPAGLARAEQGDVYTSFSHEKFRNKTQFFGTPAEDEFSSTRLNALGLVYVHPVHRGSLVFAGGYGRTRSLDFGLKIDGDHTAAQFHRTGFSEFRGTMEVYAVGGAVDVARGVSVGLSLQMWRGSDQFQQELTSQDTRNAHGDTVQFYERFAFEDTYKAWGLRAGLLYVLPSGLRLGISVTTPMTFDVKTKLEDEFEDEFENRTDTYPTEQYSDQYTLRQPFEFALGTSWSNQKLTIAGDVKYKDLQQAEYRDPPNVMEPHVSNFRTRYQSALQFHLGAEYRIRQELAVRGGYYRSPLRYTGGGNVPEIQIEKDRNVFTFGLGGRLEKTVALDLAIAVGGYRQIEGNRQDDVRTIQIFASAGFAF